jgi:beta-lactamase superfamily II metal-dependent hydrolase
MSIIKSFAVGNGDMFYIKHNSDNFSIIDCYLDESNREELVDEIITESKDKNIRRFISTHPDEDHLCGLKYFDDRFNIINFYCVENEATKSDETVNFKRYCKLRDSSEKAFYLKKGCSRKWMNQSDQERGSAGINILWPVTENEDFKEALEKAKNGESPNNISPIIKYSLKDGVSALWMGDLENDFLEKIKNKLDLSKIDIIFAPHHGRKTGKVPYDLLDKLDPEVVVIGESASKDLDYYDGYNTITQNSSGDITLECVAKKIHFYVSSEDYEVDFLDNENRKNYDNYIGTLNL